MSESNVINITVNKKVFSLFVEKLAEKKKLQEKLMKLMEEKISEKKSKQEDIDKLVREGKYTIIK